MNESLARSIEFAKKRISAEMDSTTCSYAGKFWFITLENPARKMKFAIAGLMFDDMEPENAFPPISVILECVEYIAQNAGTKTVIMSMVKENLMLSVCEQDDFHFMEGLIRDIANGRGMQA